jgi:hypothetical protein
MEGEIITGRKHFHKQSISSSASSYQIINSSRFGQWSHSSYGNKQRTKGSQMVTTKQVAEQQQMSRTGDQETFQQAAQDAKTTTTNYKVKARQFS